MTGFDDTPYAISFWMVKQQFHCLIDATPLTYGAGGVQMHNCLRVIFFILRKPVQSMLKDRQVHYCIGSEFSGMPGCSPAALLE